ncbi:M20 metallopeptidase family protein [Treponema endosymbiont of Eucomonympha sp.]|uniref:M20 metallopeptidase family protein n=1 Tax=Treponema endosymbiont of Eucomonympha sp. TaxID=1580831 RepID=UPI000B0BAF68|nr:amidohydrolase [Treponema endosymbiont of Eucomonympha sp.]
MAEQAAAGETAGRLRQLAEKHYARGVEIRHHLHRHPELSGQETETARYVAGILRECGIETQTGIGENGVLGVIRGGKPGKAVLLRADMDALAVDEQADVPYKSLVPGVMHACGHDGHTAGLLVAAMALSELRDEIPGTVKLMFQPAEENGGGAEKMLDAGILENPRVEAAFGCHLAGDVPEGQVAVRLGAAMAAPDEFRAVLKGRGGHAGHPNLTVDPIVMAAEAVTQFQTIVSRRRDPVDPAVVSVCMIRGGETHNVIPSEVRLLGTIRTFSAELREAIPREMERILKGIALGAGGSYELTVTRRYPPLINDAAATALARSALARIVGADNVLESPAPSMGGEDFAYIAERVSASFFFVGIMQGATPVVNHSPGFRWDDRVLKTASACMAQVALDFLRSA